MEELNPSSSFAARAATIFSLHWRLFTALTVMVIGVSAGIAFLMTPKYQTRMKILVKNERANPPVGMDQHTTSLVYQDEVSEARVNSEIELLTSGDLLRAVVDGSKLADQERSSRNPKAAALRRLQKALSVKSVKRSNIIEVTYASPDAEQSLRVMKNLATLYLEYHVRLNGAPGTLELFDRQVRVYQKELDQAESKLADFRKENQIVALAEEKNLALAQASNLDKQVAENDSAAQTQARQIDVLERQLTELEPRVTKEVKSVPNQYSVEHLNTLLLELRNKRTDASSKYQPTDRIVTDLDRQIAQTEKALDQASHANAIENTTDINPLFQSTYADLRRTQAQLAGTTALGKKLQEEVRLNRARLTHLDQISSLHDSLVRRVKEVEDAHASYVQKREESRAGVLLDEKHIGNVTIAEQPFLPDLPSSPNRPLIVFVGAAWGCLLSLGLGLAMTKLSSDLVRPADFEHTLSMPVLATVPDGMKQPISLRTAAPFMAGESR